MPAKTKPRLGDLIGQRAFVNEVLIEYMDERSVPELMVQFGPPEVVTLYAGGQGHWEPGDGRPGLADDDPAVMAAIAHCAMNRLRMVTTGMTFSIRHPERCGWCPYPTPELLRALDWSTHHSRLIVMERMIWRQGDRYPERMITYTRLSDRAGRYENPKWQIFHERSLSDQIAAVDKVLKESIDTMLEPDREHDPWCAYEPNHAGECSTHPRRSK